MGGMAALLLTMRNRDVDVLVSLPSGIQFEHPSGLPRISPGYDPFALRIPWLHITPTSGAAPPPASPAPSLFETARYADRYMLLTPTVGHIDLTIDGLIGGRGPLVAGAGYVQATPTGSEAQRAYEPYVLNFFAAFLAADAASRANGLAFLSRAPQESVPGWKVTLEHRPAAPASISYDEFVAAVVDGRGDEAIGRLRLVAASEPNHLLLNEANLQRLNANLLFTWGLGKEALPVIEFMAERYPSPLAEVLRAEAQIVTGNYPAATDVYTRLVEQYPNNAIARTRLEWLRSQPAEQ